MASLKDRLLKNSTLGKTSVLNESDIFKDKLIDTGIPMLNVACSGRLDGGIGKGVLMIAAPSKMFKTGFTLLMCAAFQRSDPDATILFYDSEFGAPQGYFEKFGVDQTRVVHTPITDIEQLKHDLMTQLNELTEEDKVMIVIDSIGNLASKKEVDDALDGKVVADMTRAKAFKSLFRMITPHLTLKNIPLVAINHTYKTMELYAKDVPGGGTGSYYAADTIWIVSRAQEKADDELAGYRFTIRPEKSRYIKEDARIPIMVNFESGMDTYSGLFDVAKELGFIHEPTKGYYQTVDPDTGTINAPKLRAKQIDEAYWKSLVANKKFADAVAKHYALSYTESTPTTKKKAAKSNSN
eukprot:gnl/Spiro4/24198_TR12012_c0_g1_i1.p1 gnl/Spiro4/24198_TR12012_c0_g1~~gnl/Spiro4/24198_TR12012_c0_g1_i1.p1  ORF type:complete len:353 (+),score=36.18 gnl/Spiro4/24198_TR12012_c0_g1_i1:1646-2704(+)